MRGGIVAGFLGVSLFSLWNNAGNIPFLRDLNLPSIEEVFGDSSEEAATETTTSIAAVDGDVQSPVSETGPLDSFITSASSTAGTESGGEARLAFDGDRTTGWTPCSECPSPFGQGQSLTVVFSEPVTIQEIFIFNGLEGDDSATLPISTIRVDAGGLVFDVTLGTTVDNYRIVPPDELPATSLSISIQSVVRSDETIASTVLGEIQFIGVPTAVSSENEE
jgi:hypothetical protein